MWLAWLGACGDPAPYATTSDTTGEDTELEVGDLSPPSEDLDGDNVADSDARQNEGDLDRDMGGGDDPSEGDPLLDTSETDAAADGFGDDVEDSGEGDDVGDLSSGDGGDVSLCPFEVCGAGPTCCEVDEACRFDACVPEPGTCDDEDDCPGDRYCNDGECIPYGLGPGGPVDAECSRVIEIGLYQPTVQCQWPGPGDGDPLPVYAAILSNPVVVDFAPDDSLSSPSIVFHSAGPSKGYGSMRQGAVRILDGRTCVQQTVIDAVAGRVEASTTPAVGDLDGDGVAEIVSSAFDGGLVAFHLTDEGEWEVLWHSTNADGSTSTLGYPDYLWNGPSIHDLDDDGVPEVIFEGVVHDATGRIRGSGTAPYTYYFRGNFSVIADVDDDDIAELVTGPNLYQYNSETFEFEPDPLFTGAGGNFGLIALGDFGEFEGRAGDAEGRPEVVVVGHQSARVQTIGGDVVFGPISLPGGGMGGAPTVGDFDNDGEPELAAAGKQGYTVFDFDCVGAPDGCEGEGILWSRDSQDASSACTGSSVFDFEGDGKAEAIYADECFVRVYEGDTGEVIFSAWRPSGTWYENPIVADVDGDFNSELVLQSNGSGGTCSAVDPIFAGLRCEGDLECPGTVPSCVEGYCRCTEDAHCGGGSYGCRAPLPDTPGAGNVCRSINTGSSSPLVVYRDGADRWVDSRRIWNQHAYDVTNVLEDGVIPRTSERVANWSAPGLNNFRQNVQGDLDPTLLPDLTAAGDAVSDRCDDDNAIDLQARACNRGLKSVGSAMVIGFYEGPAADGALICDAVTSDVLDPGECQLVTCPWTDPPWDVPTDVHVAVDPTDDGLVECNEHNNGAVIPAVTCRTK